MPDSGEPPENTAQWILDSDRAVLLLHDMQNFFLNAFPRGEAPVTDLIRNAEELRERCAATGIPVAYTKQPGGDEVPRVGPDHGPHVVGDLVERGRDAGAEGVLAAHRRHRHGRPPAGVGLVVLGVGARSPRRGSPARTGKR
ncbi:isochorismatase family protein [Sphaerisporangium album]|uniref:Isochorismatase family protein n=1 Tax=Sphaerisporangium album TaxID=509200 RepID=A0A367FNA0_9ACTN|nr:isochorismatase family protein [Sphaerisporangium album]